jgi:hypothetical protein
VTVTIDATGLRDRVIARFSQVADDAVQAMIVDMSEHGPRSDEAHEHMVDLVTVADFADDAPHLSRHVVSPAEYSSYVDEGTEPHEIHGNPLLVFYWPKTGRTMFLPRVQHPGTSRTGWWTDTLARWPDFVAAAMT